MNTRKPKPKVIAFTGPMGSGKSHFAGLLKSKNYLFKDAAIYPFAGPLKSMLRLILPPEAFTPEGKDDTAYGLCGKTPRYLMQTLGTEWGRKLVGEDVWVEAVRRQIVTSPSPVILMDDCRFENEAEMVLDMGGKIYLIDRPGHVWGEDHPSEVGIDCAYIDGVIPNRGDIEYFAKTFNPWEL